ncbi:ACR3 protein [Catenaria anguillulae PL171]|uniref:ACR3 protein n=1 Tax=Catenaria anguillulae PL171 TaxID=765915 RepID=A0A1Y2H588_9FUNG|nr:ACR3 protein [Catenaria anguillulae PL171]
MDSRKRSGADAAPGQAAASDVTLAPLIDSSNRPTATADQPKPSAIEDGSMAGPDAPVAVAEGMNLFQRFLTVWVLLAMLAGVLLGHFVPAVPEVLEKATIAQVSIPIAVLLWGIILPMMLQIDFSAVKNALKQPKAILLTTLVNYAVQPFTMYGIAVLFFKVIFANYLGQSKANEYLVGSLLLGGAPCTAMVFVWSTLMRGDPAYTLTQVAVNDLILLVAYSPTVKLLAGAEDIQLPWDTLLLSVGFFVLIPLVLGVLIRTWFKRNQASAKWLDTVLIPKLNDLATVFLVLMVAMLFITQAGAINSKLVDILIIAVPLLIQTLLIWGITYGLALVLRLPYAIAGPATLIACSNFFEMAVAVAISLYGSASGATLATVVGVLIEVPVMLLLVEVNNRTKGLFDRRSDV